MKKITFLLFITLLTSLKVKPANTDSLISVLPSLNDSDKVLAYFNLARDFTYNQPIESKQYVEEAIALLRKKNDTVSTYFARFHTQLGVLE